VPQGLHSGTPDPRLGLQKCSTPSTETYPSVPWTHTRLGVARVWDLTKGAGVAVAVIDTGVDASVPQLSGHVLPGVDVVNGSGPANTDCLGHGTFVAGIIAAQPREGTGVVGVAPGVTILPIRQANTNYDGTAAGLAKSIRIAADAGAKVVNISASAFFPSDELRLAVDYATARDVLLVASASNEAQSGNPKAYPAAYPQVLAVGAIGHDGRRSGFSEVGDYLSLVAPGVDIISLSRAGSGHLVDNGTSYATPFVAAAAALVRAYHPELNAARVKRRLELTADHLGVQVPNPQVGWGVVNPYNAVAMVLPEEGAQGRAGPAKPVRVPRAKVSDNSAAEAAKVFTFALLGLALGALVLAYTLPRANRRRWRPADAPDARDARDVRDHRTSRSGRHGSSRRYEGLA
jgi:type VII secretion-associated serine protease mycosin